MNNKWYMDVTIHVGSGECKQIFTRVRLKKVIRVTLKQT
jgi:hypothetical protein